MRWLLGFISLHLCFLYIQAQKYDRNWAFGYGGGINFIDTSNLITYRTITANLEIAASISDSLGNLLFYTGRENDFFGGFKIYDDNNNVITNGDSINIDLSMTNGAIILPQAEGDSLFFLFHIGIYDTNSCPFFCEGLYYSVISRNRTGDLSVITKNVLLNREPIAERLAAVRHANGKYWWVLVQDGQLGNGFPCVNKFYIYLLTNNGVHKQSTQAIGSYRCDILSQWGEMIFNKQGSQLAVAIGSFEGSIDLFDFDRCNGILSVHTVIDQQSGPHPYGCEFSPNGGYLYVSSGANLQTGKLFQYDLTNFNKTVIWIDTIGVQAGQLQIAPDSKIYFAMNWIYEPENRKVGVINQPDSAGLACNFQPFQFYLGDSSRPDWGLPNMPNYELAPLTIYKADAGEDKSWCVQDSITGAYISSPEVAGVQYSWQPAEGLDNPHIAMPFANPSKTTMYVLTATDTSIKYSCQSIDDTVWVRVENCDTTQILFPDAFTPNDDGSNDFFGPVSGIELIEFRIYNRWGQVVHDSPTKWDGIFKGTEQPMGTFVYYAIVQVENGGRKKVSGVVSLLR